MALIQEGAPGLEIDSLKFKIQGPGSSLNLDLNVPLDNDLQVSGRLRGSVCEWAWERSLWEVAPGCGASAPRMLEPGGWSPTRSLTGTCASCR